MGPKLGVPTVVIKCGIERTFQEVAGLTNA